MHVHIGETVAAKPTCIQQTASLFAHNLYLTSHPPTHGSRVSQPAFQPRGWSTGQRSQFTCPEYTSAYDTNKANILSTAVHYCTSSYRYLYGVGWYVRVCSCTATVECFHGVVSYFRIMAQEERDSSSFNQDDLPGLCR